MKFFYSGGAVEIEEAAPAVINGRVYYPADCAALSQSELTALGIYKQTLADIKADAILRVETYASHIRQVLAGTTDTIKLAGWNNKARIAESIIAGTATAAELAAMTGEATARGLGETAQALAAKILGNATLLAIAVAQVDGMESATVRAINAAPDEATIGAILAAVQAQADAAFAHLQLTVRLQA